MKKFVFLIAFSGLLGLGADELVLEEYNSHPITQEEMNEYIKSSQNEAAEVINNAGGMDAINAQATATAANSEGANLSQEQMNEEFEKAKASLSEEDKKAIEDSYNKANSQDQLSNDQIMKCGAVLCLAGGKGISECAKYLNPYYSIKKAWKRRAYLRGCPASTSNPDMEGLVDTVLQLGGADSCDEATAKDYQKKFEVTIDDIEALGFISDEPRVMRKQYQRYAQMQGIDPLSTKIRSFRVLSRTALMNKDEIALMENTWKNAIASNKPLQNFVKGNAPKFGGDSVIETYHRIKSINPVVSDKLLSKGCRISLGSNLTLAYQILRADNKCVSKNYESLDEFLASGNADCKAN